MNYYSELAFLALSVALHVSILKYPLSRSHLLGAFVSFIISFLTEEFAGSIFGSS
jgi:hypothetical protein